MRRRVFDHVNPYLAPPWRDPPEPPEEQDEPRPVRKNGFLILRVDNAYTNREAHVSVVAEHADEQAAYQELAFLRHQTPSHAGHITHHLIKAAWS